MEVIKIIILSLSGLLLSFVGVMRLSNPIKTYLKNSGIELENDVNLINEVKGISAVQLVTGLLCILGIFLPEMAMVSFTAGSLIFLGFAVGRFISVVTDGRPNQMIVQGLIFEVVFGVANLWGLMSVIG